MKLREADNQLTLHTGAILQQYYMGQESDLSL